MLRRVSWAFLLAAFATLQSGCGILCCGPCGLFGPSCGNEWCGYDCGEAYYGDWWGCCDPCDDCGNWNGGGCCHGGHAHTEKVVHHGHQHHDVIEGDEVITEEIVEQEPEEVAPKEKRSSPAFKAPKKEPLHKDKAGAKEHAAPKSGSGHGDAKSAHADEATGHDDEHNADE